MISISRYDNVEIEPMMSNIVTEIVLCSHNNNSSNIYNVNDDGVVIDRVI
ncbi:MAG: hypothetical protein R2801_00235 [Chitinophagales bacterium]